MVNHLSDDQDYQLWVRFNQARDVIFRAREKELGQYDITPRQVAILFTLKILNDIKVKATIVEISRWVLREAHSVSRILTRMETEGLVSRSKGVDKRNEVVINLTEKGEQAYTQSLNRESIREIMSCISEEDRQQLFSYLKKLREKGLEYLAEKAKVHLP
ncbi:MarR family winged helix-turn-helix transcriptional regulator [Chloroflexota bacterium]